MRDELTADERRAIEWDCAKLINLYASLNDEGRWAEVAALYAEDGSMTAQPPRTPRLSGATRSSRHSNRVHVARRATFARTLS